MTVPNLDEMWGERDTVTRIWGNNNAELRGW
jgi:hypothetical protein